MQLKHKHLLNALIKNNYRVNNVEININKELFSDNEQHDLMQIYKGIGGIRDEYPLVNKIWHFIEPHTVIVLDDCLHFNRYRGITLRSTLYNQMFYFSLDNYKRYCRNFEKECIKSGLQKGEWSNRESDYYFGISELPGDFFKNGSGGWKMRAFKDYLEDYAALKLNYKLIRFSVFDNFLAEGKLIRLDDILQSSIHPLENQMMNYVSRKINS